MAKMQKFDTIEEAAAASGIEINDQTRPFLESFVKKASNLGGVSAGAKRKALYDEVVAMGIDDLDFEKETMDSLKVRGCQYLFSMGEFDALDEFAGRFNLAVDHETGAVHRVKAKVKPIEERNAGKKEGTIGWLTIQLLQSEEHADLPVSDLVAQFSDFAAELGYPDVKPTTAPSIQWYINYCRKTGVEICERKKVTKAAVEGGQSLGAELTLEKALAPKQFKKKAPVEETGADLDLGGEVADENAEVAEEPVVD